jgi:hypothetical protein
MMASRKPRRRDRSRSARSLGYSHVRTQVVTTYYHILRDRRHNIRAHVLPSEVSLVNVAGDSVTGIPAALKQSQSAPRAR